ncbi:MAG TPA: nucleotidyltransferase family protein [archaeon]|nr:nucleotidyltransferase family protein [archaeon]
MKSLILAAGRGAGAMPLTENVPKSLIAVGRKPFLWNIITNLQLAGSNEIGIVVGWKKEKIKDFIFKEGFKNITFIEQSEPKGTAHAVSLAKDFVGGENFLVVMGDNLYSPADLKEILNSGGNCIAATEHESPEEYGVVLHENGILKEIIEKPAAAESNLINAGAYFFTPEIFSAIEKISGNGNMKLPDAVNALAQSEKVKVHKLNGYWFDFGTIEDIMKIEEKMEELK